MVTPPCSGCSTVRIIKQPVVTRASMRNDLKAAAFLSEDEAVLNQLKPRGRKQNEIQSRLPFLPVHSSRWGAELRFHKVILSAARHGFSLQVQCLPFRMAHISDMSIQVASYHNTASRRCGHAPFCQPSRTADLSPSRQAVEDRVHQQEVKLRRFDPFGPSSPMYTSLWRGPFTDLPEFNKRHRLTATLRPACRFVPRSIPLKQSVSGKPTVSHKRAMGPLAVWCRSERSRDSLGE